MSTFCHFAYLFTFSVFKLQLRSGEEAIKVAEGDKNWRDMQSRMHRLHEAAAAQQVRRRR